MWADAQRDGRPAEHRWRPCESSIIQFLVPRCKVWLTPAPGVLCSNAANIGEHKTWTQSEFCTWKNSVSGQESPKMYIKFTSPKMAKHCAKFGWPPLTDDGAVTKPRCKTGSNLLGCPKLANRSQPLVRRNSPYCEDLWRTYCHLTSFYSVSIHALVAKI